MAPETRREHKFSQVMNLLNRADDPRTPADEASTARKLAEKLMRVHAFEEEEIRQATMKSGGTVETPEIRQFDIYDSGNPFSGHLYSMFHDLARHCRCRLATAGNRPKEGGRAYEYTRYYYVVGFASDLDFLGLLYMSVRLAFSSNVEPPFDPTDYDGSVARMHLAGITWQEIAHRTGTSWPDNHKLRRTFYRWADANGVSRDDGHRRSPRTYRRSFADGFCDTISMRLWRMREQAEKEQAAEYGERFALALRSRETVVQEFLYERFPDFRPKPASEVAKYEPPKGKQPKYRPLPVDPRAMAAGRRTAERVNLSVGSGVRGSDRKEIG